jgi:hypothetical protein
MNERITKIVIDTLGKEGVIASRALGHWALSDEELEEFAELLIQECATYVKNSNCFTYASQADLCAERMNKHFGIDHEN